MQPIAIESKICTGCKEAREPKEFPLDRSSKDGLYYRCKSCVREASNRNWRDPVKKALRLKACAEYRRKFPERVKATAARHRAKPESKFKKKLYSMAYYQSPERKAHIRNWQRNRAKINPAFRIANICRCRIYACLGKKHGQSRSLKFIGLSSYQELVNYLESKFQPGMNWDNYGKWGWHVDHKTPLSWFNLLDEFERQKAFHYTNLQPLWWWENVSKSNRRQS